MQNPHTCRLLDACGGNTRPHEPHFDMAESDGGCWIRDGGRPIAFIKANWLTLDAFEFSPFWSLDRDTAISPYYDMGTYINMHATLLHAIPRNFQWPTKRCTLVWDTSNPAELRLVVEADYMTGEETVNELSVGFDRDTGQYLYRMRKHLRQPVQKRQEFCTVYPKRLGDGMPDTKKWQYTVWTGPDGRLRKMPHTPAFAVGVRHWDDGRTKHVAPQGFLGWGVEDDFNLAVVFEKCSVPLLSATCDMWYDEHLTFGEPYMENLVAGPCSEVEVSFRLMHVPAPVMRGLIDDAHPIEISKEETAAASGPAFIFNQVNDLEEPMDPNVPQAGQIWQTATINPGLLEIEDAGRVMAGTLDPANHVHWADDCGHAGRRSMRLKGIAHKIMRLAPAGHSPHVKPDTVYRFEGWIRTQGAEGRLSLCQTWYSFQNVYGQVTSETVEPDSDWTKVQVDLRTERYPFAFCRLEVEGDGFAWFDDLHWFEVEVS